MKKCLVKLFECFGYLAIFVATLSANTTCSWFIHQPKTPKSLKKLKK